jgi:septal ring factor EnvC (AmiA/AmiB activator)
MNKNRANVALFHLYHPTLFVSSFKMSNLNQRESNMAPLQEDIDAMRVSLQQEAALLQVLEAQIERVMPDHSQAALQLARAQAALDAASRVFRTSDSMLQGLKRQSDHLEASIA